MGILIDCDVKNVNGTAKGRVTACDGSQLVHEDRIDLSSATSRKRFAVAVARKLIDPDAQNGRKQVEAATAEVDKLLLAKLTLLRESATPPPAKPTPEDHLAEMSEKVRADAAALLRDPKLIDRIRASLELMGIAGGGRVGFGVYVIGTSRLLDRPISGIVRGATSAGKSYEITQPARLFPPEAKLEAHKLSPTALYYLPDDALIHRFVVGGERSRRQDGDSSDATKALREMISDGVLQAAVTEKVDGRLVTIQYEKEGPIAYVESTSGATVFAEDANRCLVFNIDESPEQTRRIIRACAEAATGRKSDVSDLVIQTHHAMQRMLKPYKVIVPFAELIAERFPAERVEARRAMPHLLGTIKSVALLRQYQKPVTGDGAIAADAEDYAVALDVMRPTLVRLTGAMDEQAKRVWAAVRERAGEDEFTRNAAAVWAGIRESDAGGRLRLLAELGYVLETQEHKGNRPAKFKIAADAPAEEPEAGTDLPTVDDIRNMCGEDSSK